MSTQAFFTSRWSRQMRFEMLPTWAKKQLEIQLREDSGTLYDNTDQYCLKFGAQKYVIPMFACESIIDSEGVHVGYDTQVQLIVIDGGKTYWLYASNEELITSYYFSRSGKTLIVHLFDWIEKESRTVVLDADGNTCNAPRMRRYSAR